MIDENKKQVVEALKNANETDVLNSEEMDATEGGFLNRCTYTQTNSVAGCGGLSAQIQQPSESIVDGLK